MIQLSGAGKRFGHKLLFEDLDWTIGPRERVGIVGANGTGKSTLLKILAGMESLDYGALSCAKGLTFGYLPQDGLELSGRSVFEECMLVFAGLREMEREMEALTHAMAEIDHNSPEYAEVADRYHQLQGEFTTHDGYALDAKVSTVLAGLGFSKEDWQRRTEEFSGGWQMRISLAKLLLQQPNLLLLDEPTNHLDLETRNWLEEYLHDYPYAFLVISHDRYFLDVTVDRTVEIWNKKVHFYSGNYEKYLKQKAEQREQIEAAYRNQKVRIDQLEAFINRFRYQATKARQVQSRIKELEKIERVEVPEEEKTIHFHFPQPKPSGRNVAEFQGVAKSYDRKLVFQGVRFVIERGDRVALVGVNGAGKSTLIKLLAEIEPLTAGKYEMGYNAEPAYYAQDQYKELDPTARLLDDLREAWPRGTETALRSLLGCFLFSDDDVYKQLGVLSGGERNRYALARLMMAPSNFLLLDEPTNHLDLRAKDVLLTALQDYTGTVVFVSHDRYFIDKLATRVFEIGEGRVEVYPGNYEDYLWRKAGGADALAAATESRRVAEAANAGPAAAPPGESKAETKAETKTPAKRINPIKLRQMQVRVAEMEQEIARREAALADHETALTHFVSAAETERVTRLLAQGRKDLEKMVAEWESLSAELEPRMNADEHG
jgi:ATP-binding cassette subfamily F protein 3